MSFACSSQSSCPPLNHCIFANVDSVVYGYMKYIVCIDVLCIFLPKLFDLNDLFKTIKTKRFSSALPPLVLQRLVVLDLLCIDTGKRATAHALL